jgi:hypothetical protein
MTPHADLATLRVSITVDWDRLAMVYIRKTCHSFYLLEATVVKNGAFIE